MRLYHELRAFLEWYRALRSLHRILGQVTGLLLLASTSACAGGESPTGVALSARTTVRLANAEQHGIWFVRTRNCGTSQWSADLLDSEVIPAGTQRTLKLAPGCVDLRLETTTALGGVKQWDRLELQAGAVVPVTLEEWSFAPPSTRRSVR